MEMLIRKELIKILGMRMWKNIKTFFEQYREMGLMYDTMWINHNQLNVSLFTALKEN